MSQSFKGPHSTTPTRIDPAQNCAHFLSVNRFSKAVGQYSFVPFMVAVLSQLLLLLVVRTTEIFKEVKGPVSNKPWADRNYVRVVSIEVKNGVVNDIIDS